MISLKVQIRDIHDNLLSQWTIDSRNVESEAATISADLPEEIKWWLGELEDDDES